MGIEFDDEFNQTAPTFAVQQEQMRKQKSGLGTWLTKKGIVKNDTQATYLLLVLAVALCVSSIVMAYFTFGQDSKPSPIKREFRTSSQSF